MEHRSMEWNKSYSVGLELADNQHAKFLEIINKLGDFIAKEESAVKGNEYFFSLISFAENYLLKEKMLVNSLEDIDYSYFRDKHSLFLSELIKYQKAFEQNPKKEVLQDFHAYLKTIYQQFIAYYTPSLVNKLKENGLN